MLGVRVGSADLERAVVTTGTGTQHHVRGLMIATGIRPRRVPPEDRTLTGRHVLRTLEDAQRMRSELRRRARVIIGGAGLVGCEVAAAARHLGCEVTVIGSTGRPMQGAVGPLVGAELQRRHEAEGIRFKMSTRVTAVHGKERVESVALSDDTHAYGDVLVEAIELFPTRSGSPITTSPRAACSPTPRCECFAATVPAGASRRTRPRAAPRPAGRPRPVAGAARRIVGRCHGGPPRSRAAGRGGAGSAVVASARRPPRRRSGDSRVRSARTHTPSRAP